MPVIESKIMINSKSFKKNQQDHAKLIDEVRTLEKKLPITQPDQKISLKKEANYCLEIDLKNYLILEAFGFRCQL